MMPTPRCGLAFCPEISEISEPSEISEYSKCSESPSLQAP